MGLRELEDKTGFIIPENTTIRNKPRLDKTQYIVEEHLEGLTLIRQSVEFLNDDEFEVRNSQGTYIPPSNAIILPPPEDEE